MASLQDQAAVLSIADETLDQVCTFAGYNAGSEVDAQVVCVLLITTVATDVRGVLAALFAVFGTEGAIPEEQLRALLAQLAMFDPQQWGTELLESLDAQLGGKVNVTFADVADFACIAPKALAACI